MKILNIKVLIEYFLKIFSFDNEIVKKFCFDLKKDLEQTILKILVNFLFENFKSLKKII